MGLVGSLCVDIYLPPISLASRKSLSHSLSSRSVWYYPKLTIAAVRPRSSHRRRNSPLIVARIRIRLPLSPYLVPSKVKP